VAGGSIALGESYLDGWWECDALDQFFNRILKFRLDQKVKHQLWQIVFPDPAGGPVMRV
jgi:cyclopropane-fatty-acyl-phospholipid synthase